MIEAETADELLKKIENMIWLFGGIEG
jgi:hypothetical protein